MSTDEGFRVEPYQGPRANLRELFLLAEDSEKALDSYIDAGRVLVALHEGEVIGHVQLTENEVKSIAVASHWQGRGVGRALAEAVIALAREEGQSALWVATSAADVGNLAFYQRLGFRMRSVERDAFTPEGGYDLDVRERVWLELALGDAR